MGRGDRAARRAAIGRRAGGSWIATHAVAALTGALVSVAVMRPDVPLTGGDFMRSDRLREVGAFGGSVGIDRGRSVGRSVGRRLLTGGWEAEEARLSGLRASHLEDHPFRRGAVDVGSDQKHVDDTLARMFASVNRASAAAHAEADGDDAPVGWRMGRESDQAAAAAAAARAAAAAKTSESVDDAENAALAALDAKDDAEEKAFVVAEENEIEKEAEAIVDKATDHELHMDHSGRLTNVAETMALETHKWAAMDSSQLRVELHHIATERNKAAAAVGAIARNCSGELEALYFKFKKKKQARDELREEFEQLKHEKEKIHKEHKDLKEHVSAKVLKHMEDAGIDTEFIKPDHMDVDDLLAAAAKADNEKRAREMRDMIRQKEKLKQAVTMEELLGAGNKKKISQHVKNHEFKSLSTDITDPRRIRRMAAGKDPDKPSKSEQKKMEKEAEKAAKKHKKHDD